MCWSSEVSWAFAWLDLGFIAVLLYQKYSASVNDTSSNDTRFHGTYAAFMAAIASQEWAQYFVWSLMNLDASAEDYCSRPLDYILSAAAMLSSQIVPIVLIASSHVAAQSIIEQEQKNNVSNNGDSITTESLLLQQNNHQEQPHNNSSAAFLQTSSRHRRHATLAWLAQFVGIWVAVAWTGKYCIQIGPNHHQVWICGQALHDLAGWPGYFAFLALYVTSAWQALQSHPTLPPTEIKWIVHIALANGAVAYGLYCWTLEACSIWCWAGFSFGVYFCTKDVAAFQWKVVARYLSTPTRSINCNDELA